MNKTFENVILGSIVAALTIATVILNSEVSGSNGFNTEPKKDVEDIKRYLKKKYKQIDDDLDEEYRDDVYVGVFNRNVTYIEDNACKEDQRGLYKYNERLYNRYF